MKLENFISFAKGRVFYCLLVLWMQSAIGSATTLTDLPQDLLKDLLMQSNGSDSVPLKRIAAFQEFGTIFRALGNSFFMDRKQTVLLKRVFLSWNMFCILNEEDLGLCWNHQALFKGELEETDVISLHQWGPLQKIFIGGMNRQSRLRELDARDDLNDTQKGIRHDLMREHGICALTQDSVLKCLLDRPAEYGYRRTEVPGIPAKYQASNAITDVSLNDSELGEDRPGCAIRKQDGIVECWGSSWLENSFDHRERDWTPRYEENLVRPESVGKMRSIEVNKRMGCGIGQDHLFHCWGALNDRSWTQSRSCPTVPDRLGKVQLFSKHSSNGWWVLREGEDSPCLLTGNPDFSEFDLLESVAPGEATPKDAVIAMRSDGDDVCLMLANRSLKCFELQEDFPKSGFDVAPPRYRSDDGYSVHSFRSFGKIHSEYYQQRLKTIEGLGPVRDFAMNNGVITAIKQDGTIATLHYVFKFAEWRPHRSISVLVRKPTEKDVLEQVSGPSKKIIGAIRNSIVHSLGKVIAHTFRSAVLEKSRNHFLQSFARSKDTEKTDRQAEEMSSTEIQEKQPSCWTVVCKHLGYLVSYTGDLGAVSANMSQSPVLENSQETDRQAEEMPSTTMQQEEPFFWALVSQAKQAALQFDSEKIPVFDQIARTFGQKAVHETFIELKQAQKALFGSTFREIEFALSAILQLREQIAYDTVVEPVLKEKLASDPAMRWGFFHRLDQMVLQVKQEKEFFSSVSGSQKKALSLTLSRASPADHPHFAVEKIAPDIDLDALEDSSRQFVEMFILEIAIRAMRKAFPQAILGFLDTLQPCEVFWLHTQEKVNLRKYHMVDEKILAIMQTAGFKKAATPARMQALQEEAAKEIQKEIKNFYLLGSGCDASGVWSSFANKTHPVVKMMDRKSKIINAIIAHLEAHREAHRGSVLAEVNSEDAQGIRTFAYSSNEASSTRVAENQDAIDKTMRNQSIETWNAIFERGLSLDPKLARKKVFRFLLALIDLNIIQVKTPQAVIRDLVSLTHQDQSRQGSALACLQKRNQKGESTLEPFRFDVLCLIENLGASIALFKQWNIPQFAAKMIHNALKHSDLGFTEEEYIMLQQEEVKKMKQDVDHYHRTTIQKEPGSYDPLDSVWNVWNMAKEVFSKDPAWTPWRVLQEVLNEQDQWLKLRLPYQKMLDEWNQLEQETDEALRVTPKYSGDYRVTRRPSVGTCDWKYNEEIIRNANASAKKRMHHKCIREECPTAYKKLSAQWEKLLPKYGDRSDPLRYQGLEVINQTLKEMIVAKKQMLARIFDEKSRGMKDYQSRMKEDLYAMLTEQDSERNRARTDRAWMGHPAEEPHFLFRYVWAWHARLQETESERSNHTNIVSTSRRSE